MLGFWVVLREVFPATRGQRCWFHTIADVLNCLSKSSRPGVEPAPAQIWGAEDRDHAQAVARACAAEYGVNRSMGRRDDQRRPEVLPASFYHPAEHRVHLRTTNPIESAQARWRAVNAPHLLALVCAGARFGKCVLVERRGEPSAGSGGNRQRAWHAHQRVLTILHTTLP